MIPLNVTHWAFNEFINVHISFFTMAENKNTKWKCVSISSHCPIEQDAVYLANNALRQHNYCNLQSNGGRLNGMFFC